MTLLDGDDNGFLFLPEVSEEEIRREKAKARELRKSPWWKRRRGEGTCHYCGAPVPPGELTMDHVVPIVRGGKTTKSNVVPACAECNAKKKYMLPVEWRAYMDSLKEA